MKRRIIFLIAIQFTILNSIAQNNLNELKFLITSCEYIKAVKTGEDIATKFKNNAEYYYLLSLANKGLLKYNNAFTLIKKALKTDSTKNIYWAEYADLLVKKKRYYEAQKVYEKLVKENPGHFNTGVKLVKIYYKNKEYSRAYQVLYNLHLGDTSNSYISYNLGKCSIKLKDQKKSIQWLNKSIASDSLYIPAYESLAVVYTSINDFDLALGILDKAINKDPENLGLHRKKGDIHTMRNHNYRAIPAYKKVYELDKEDPSVLREIGICYFKVKKYSQSINYLKLAESKFSDLKVYTYLAHSYNKIYKTDSALYYYDKCLEILNQENNTVFNILNHKAENLYKQAKYSEAVLTYKMAENIQLTSKWKASSKNQLYIDIASIYHEKLGKKEEAIEYYNKVKKSEIIFNTNYYEYAQQKIKEIKEELFFEQGI